MPLYLKQKRERKPIEPALTPLEAAKRRIAASGIHFNFGSDIEARRRWYEGIVQAKALLEANGYTVRRKSFGYEIVEPDKLTQ